MDLICIENLFLNIASIVGFGINFTKESVFFTKNGKLVYESNETFAGDPKFQAEPLYNLKSLYATISLVEDVEIKANMGSHPFKFDLIQYQQKKVAPQGPSWLRREPRQDILKPYSEISKFACFE